MGSSSSSPKCELVSEALRINPVNIFSATYCVYCKIAKRTFDELGTSYNAIELNHDPNGKEIMHDLKENYTQGQQTVPQIFICGRWIGGCEEMRRMHKSGELQELIKDCCQGDITCQASQ